MLTVQIRVTGGFIGIRWFGGTVSSFGATLIPFLIGARLFFMTAVLKQVGP